MVKNIILVTGASGYLALHVIDQSLKHGYNVRGTVRNLNEKERLEPIESLIKIHRLPVELVEADLLKPDTWDGAMKDVSVVMHVASPFPNEQPKDEQDVIRPAVEGTLNVLHAAYDNGVRRVIMTSSTAAISGQSRIDNKLYTEKDWPDLEKVTNAYIKSKVLAEKAAWNFVDEKKKQGLRCFDLVVLNPGYMFGPSLNGPSSRLGTSVKRILELLDGTLNKIPNYSFVTCDVRDVALANVKAAFIPEAGGHRIPISSDPNYLPCKVWADILSREFSSKGYKIPRELDTSGPPNFKSKIDDSRMRNVLGITPIDLKKDSDRHSKLFN